MTDLEEIAQIARASRATPFRAFLPLTAGRRFTEVSARLARMDEGRVRFRAAYSVKTNPSENCLSLALRSAMLAEAIGPEEVSGALDSGFALDEILYNGPFALSGAAPRVGVAFADSPLAFADYVRRERASILGLRVRPRRVESRFGITWEELPAIVEMLAAVPARDLGVSFHARAEDLEREPWPSVLEDALAAAEMLEGATNQRVAVFDVGGGRDPAGFDEWFEGEFRPSIPRIRRRLGNLRTIVVELGQEVATPAACLVTTVVEDRRRRAAAEIVVDGCISLLSHVRAYPHPTFLLSGERLLPLRPGAGRILGSACLEDDILAVDVDLPELAAGDRIVFASCGSYDASMAYNFATGTLCEVQARRAPVPEQDAVN